MSAVGKLGPRTMGLTALLYAAVFISGGTAVMGSANGSFGFTSASREKIVLNDDNSNSVMLCDGCYRGVLGRLTTQAPVDLAGLGNSIRAQSDSDLSIEDNGGFRAFLRWYLSQER